MCTSTRPAARDRDERRAPAPRTVGTTADDHVEAYVVKPGRFVVDTHVHVQRFAAGPRLKESGALELSGGAQWEALGEAILDLVPYDNSGRLLDDMDRYGVDACVLLPAFGMNNEINADLVERHPNRFAALCYPVEHQKRIDEGEDEWTIEAVCEELDRLLYTGRFVGIGEGMPYMPHPPDAREVIDHETAIGNCLAVMEVARRHGVCVKIHTGWAMGYAASYSTTKGRRGPLNLHPLLAHDLAAAFPDVPIVFDHGGVQGWWSEKLQEECLHVAAAHDNVYLECGLWWRELFERALADPNVGADKLMWGTDWGASLPFHGQPGRTPPSYPLQIRRDGMPAHQIDFWGWSFRELWGLRVPQDDLNLILGGNAARVYGLEPPHPRMFRERRV
jgi:predicted TIM-barrel fold metal-dependent hydrolase